MELLMLRGTCEEVYGSISEPWAREGWMRDARGDVVQHVRLSFVIILLWELK